MFAPIVVLTIVAFRFSVVAFDEKLAKLVKFPNPMVVPVVVVVSVVVVNAVDVAVADVVVLKNNQHSIVKLVHELPTQYWSHSPVASAQRVPGG